MKHLVLIFLIVIAIVGVVATAIRLAIDYHNGDVDANPPIDGILFVIVISPFAGWVFIAD